MCWTVEGELRVSECHLPYLPDSLWDPWQPPYPGQCQHNNPHHSHCATSWEQHDPLKWDPGLFLSEWELGLVDQSLWTLQCGAQTAPRFSHGEEAKARGGIWISGLPFLQPLGEAASTSPPPTALRHLFCPLLSLT